MAKAPLANELSELSKAMSAEKAEDEIVEGEQQEAEQGVEKAAAHDNDIIKAAPDTALRDLLKSEYGVDFGSEVTDKDLAPRIGKILGEHQALQQQLAETKAETELRDKQLGEYLEAQEDFQQYRQAKQKEAATSKEAQSKPQWKSLEYDPEWETAADFDKDSRRWVPKRKFGPFGNEAAERLNDYAREQAERARRLTSDPWGLVREAGADAEFQKIRSEFEDKLKTAREEVLRELTSQKETEKATDAIQSWTDAHNDLFETDGSLSVLGRIYRAAAEEAHQDFGIQDTAKLHKYAAKAYEAAVKASKSTAAAEQVEKSAKEKSAEQKKKFIDGNHKAVNRITNRDGTLATAKANGEAANKFLDFRKMVVTDPDNAEYLGSLYEG